MNVIYIPKGRAREYTEIAANFYAQCEHGCLYCMCPKMLRKTLKEFSTNISPRKNILKLFEKDCMKAPQEIKEKELLFSFMSDCYQSDESAALTRKALLLAEAYGFKKVTVLTKAGGRLVNDFDILKRNPGWKFGSTIIFKSEKLREKWEPGAPPIQSRYEAVKLAHAKGIYTWISLEPVVDTSEALQVIHDLKPFVNSWKVGKLNHFPEYEATIDWRKFYYDAFEALKGCSVYWKRDLLKFK